MKKLFKRNLIIIGSVLAGVLSLAYFVFFLPNNFDDSKGKIVTVSRGASFQTLVDSLARSGTIRSRWAFKLAGRLLGYTKSIKTGKYLFVSGQSNLDILKDVSVGKSRLIITITIPEGWRMEKIAKRFERDLGIESKQFLSYCRNEKFIREKGINAKSLEGYLMPETYAFYWQTDENEIVARMIDEFKRFYNDSLLKRQEQLGETQIDVLTLASIVEAESSLDVERPTIAGVYRNRLKKKMRLEADPTVQYALGEGRRLTHRDLEINSHYNTYQHFGLPPGPINNPGKSAIIASLYPTEHEYLFFVATGIGGHRFAKTFADHENNIRKYFRTRREIQRQVKR